MQKGIATFSIQRDLNLKGVDLTIYLDGFW